MSNKPNILFVGEAMLELVTKDNATLGKSFAGDVFNTSVYMQRAFPQITTSFMTAIGTDKLSEEFYQSVLQENVDGTFIARDPHHHMGAYMVVNDSDGERSFIYWRSDSAAKRLMSSLGTAANDVNADAVFFSGITIAVLLPEERELFWQFIGKMRDKGSTIIFDPNYRARLWESVDVAKQQMDIAFTLSDWCLPGLEDFGDLYGLDSIEQCVSFSEKYKFDELIIKQGKNEVHIVNKSGHEINEIIASKNVVDTTSAGDAFNGIYLGARLTGQTTKNSTRFANYSASKVIETPGAIMPASAFEKAMVQWHESN